MPPAAKPSVALREKQNWLIHMQYTRQEYAHQWTLTQAQQHTSSIIFILFSCSRNRYDACLKTIEAQLKDCRGMAEYPIYVKALIKRQRGEINESLQLFQAATCLNPHNLANLKQVGRSLYLLARHKAALDVYEEALRIGVDDWEICARVYHGIDFSLR